MHCDRMKLACTGRRFLLSRRCCRLLTTDSLVATAVSRNQNLIGDRRNVTTFRQLFARLAYSELCCGVHRFISWVRGAAGSANRPPPLVARRLMQTSEMFLSTATKLRVATFLRGSTVPPQWELNFLARGSRGIPDRRFLSCQRSEMPYGPASSPIPTWRLTS